MGRFERSLELAKASWLTLRKDRELLWLPVIGFGAAAVLVGVLVGAAFAADAVQLDTADGEPSITGLGIFLAIVGGVLLSILATFVQAAMVAGAYERFSGGDPTVSSAIGAAFERLAVIVPWGILVWTVGTVLRAIEERSGLLGRIIVGFIGMAFRVVTFLSVPVLVVEALGPIDTLKRSGQLLKRTWGENLIAQVGLGLIGLLAMLPVVVVSGLLFAAGLEIIGVIVAVLAIAAVVVVMNSLTATYQTALYLYATTAEVPTGFESTGLQEAFRQR